MRISRYLVNEGPKWLLLAVWILVNSLLFLISFFHYHNGDNYFYLNQLLGLGLPFARASAACLNLNCLLLLLPVCRNLVSHLRHFCVSRKLFNKSIRRLLDKSIAFHRAIVWMICLHTVIHVAAHCFNLDSFMQAWAVPGLLSRLCNINNGSSVLNPVRSDAADSRAEMFKMVAGPTGLVATLVLAIMISSATEILRRYHFELFWWNHQLFLMFYVALVFHGFQGVIKPQVNLMEHDPKVCAAQFREWGKAGMCPEPYFQAIGASSWKWFVVPCVIYMLERGLRVARCFQSTVISKVVFHPSRVIELQMTKRRAFCSLPGQYVYIQCPEISHVQWHPFTLTSTPIDDFISVHIRCVGDWTNRLKELLELSTQNSVTKPRLYVDGPFGTAAEDTLQYEIDIMIGTGIGITPFASVLRHVWQQLSLTQESSSQLHGKLRKIYFYWLCPDFLSFEWFGELLLHLEELMRLSAVHKDILDVNVFLTRGWDDAQARRIATADAAPRDLLTGLQSKTNFGRPQWPALFDKVINEHPGSTVGVFFCGPNKLSKELHNLCNQYSSLGAHGVRFYYNKEHF